MDPRRPIPDPRDAAVRSDPCELTDELLTPADLMKIFKLKRSKIYELIATMPTIDLGRGVRVRRSALEEWLRDRERLPARR